MLINTEQNFPNNELEQIISYQANARKITLSKFARFYFKKIIDFSWANQGEL